MITSQKPDTKSVAWKKIFLQTTTFIRETRSTILFGIFLSLPFFISFLLQTSSSEGNELDLLLIAPKILVAFLLCTLIFFAGEAGLILSFAKKNHSPLEFVAATGAIIRWYFLITLILLGFFALFFLPILMTTGSSVALLKYVGFLFFIPITCGIIILKTFGGFYLLLSRLSLRSALESAANLFSDHFKASIIFFLATTTISLFVGFLLNIFQELLHFPLSESVPINGIILLVLLFLAVGFNIFIRVFWYFFFESIAGKTHKGWQVEKKMVEKTMAPAQEEA